MEIRQTEVFASWLARLKDARTRARIVARIDRLAHGGVGGMRMATKTSAFDAAEHLTSDEAIATFVDEALGSADAANIAHALGIVVRAKGVAEIARNAGVSREHLYRALKDTGNPEFSTIVRVLTALGLRLSAQPIAEEKPKLRTRGARKAT